MEEKRCGNQDTPGKTIYMDEVSVRGTWIKLPAIDLYGKRIIITGRLLKLAKPKEEWCEDIQDPGSIICRIKEMRTNADIFTFWQKLPDASPKFNFYQDLYSLAALPIKSYDIWWKEQIGPKTRNMVRKSEKKGVKVELVDFDDALVQGITEIFNETPVRQGNQFPHYGKTSETVKGELSKNLRKKIFLGAYYENELVGFSILFNAGTFAVTNHFLCKIAYRDKAAANGLMAKAIEVCSNRKIPFLVYGNWHERSLGDFARNNGFQKIDLPRYYIPLTYKGKIAIRLGLHRGLIAVIPRRLKLILVELRRIWFSMLLRSKKNKLKNINNQED